MGLRLRFIKATGLRLKVKYFKNRSTHLYQMFMSTHWHGKTSSLQSFQDICTTDKINSFVIYFFKHKKILIILFLIQTKKIRCVLNWERIVIKLSIFTVFFQFLCFGSRITTFKVIFRPLKPIHLHEHICTHTHTHDITFTALQIFNRWVLSGDRSLKGRKLKF